MESKESSNPVHDAADGYFSLGMIEEGWAVLDEAGVTDQEGFELIRDILKRLIGSASRELAVVIVRSAVSRLSNYSQLYLIGAPTIRVLEGVESAFEFLESGHHCLYMTPRYWYLLGCYHCLLGRLEEAEHSVYMAVGSGQEEYQRLAKEDEDLKPLWDVWSF